MATVRAVAPAWGEFLPWTDKRGRFHTLRAVTFIALLAPGVTLLIRWMLGTLGPRAANAAIHSTGYYAVWILLASLVVTPAKVLTAIPNLVVIRRMIGNAALFYAAIHLLLYSADQNWRLPAIVSEILSRFYLTIGFVTLVGLCVLGVTSTDGWIRTLGRTWKRLHRVVYALCLLGLAHYMLQSKLDVSQALLATGVFTWLMIWRLLPAGKDRSWGPLLCTSVAAAILTLGVEYAWYRFGTRSNPIRVLLGETDIGYGLRPAGQVLAFGLLVTLVAEIRRLALTPLGRTPGFTIGIYALGAFTDDVAALIMGWKMVDEIDDTPAPVMDLVWIVLLGLLGMARWKLRNRWQRHLLDAVWVACLVDQVMLAAGVDRRTGSVTAGLIVVAALILGQRIWKVSRGAALTMVPVALILAYEAVALL